LARSPQRWLSTAFVAATLLGTTLPAVAQPEPDVRDHRQSSDRDDDGPREAPPPLRMERREVRRGFTWIPGRWEWSRRQWNWLPGHWERERSGKRWRESRWERANDRWVLIDGDWVDVNSGPTAAPPPPREERWEPRPGSVWIRGRWDWRDGGWTWRDGRFEPERERERWQDGRWELRGDRWEWIEGGWAPRPPEPPPPPRPRDEPVVLVSAASGKCLDAGGGAKREGTPLQLWQCNGTEAQAFVFRILGGDQVHVVHADSGLCADVAPRGGNDPQLRLARCTGTPNQVFGRVGAGGGFQLVNAGNGRCLDVEGRRSDNGTRILHWACHGGPNQVWRQGTESPPPRPRDEPVVLVSAASGKCLDAGGGMKREGTPLQLWQCNGTEAQAFAFRALGGGQLGVVHAGSGLCVDVTARGNDAQLRLGRCTGAPSQAFARVVAGNGFQLVSATNGHCVDVEGRRSDNGTHILHWACNGGPNQLWRFPGGSPPPPPPPPPPARDVQAGPIWNQADAEAKCPQVCRPPERWNGQWRTTDPGRMSVCSCSR